MDAEKIKTLFDEISKERPNHPRNGVIQEVRNRYAADTGDFLTIDQIRSALEGAPDE